MYTPEAQKSSLATADGRKAHTYAHSHTLTNRPRTVPAAEVFNTTVPALLAALDVQLGELNEMFSYSFYVHYSGSQSVQSPKQTVGQNLPVTRCSAQTIKRARLCIQPVMSKFHDPTVGIHGVHRLFSDATLRSRQCGMYQKAKRIYSIQIKVTSRGAMLLPLVGCVNSASQSLLVLIRKGVAILKDFCTVVRMEMQLSSDQRGTTIRI